MDIQQARGFIDANLESGVECPVCGQLCKLYKRHLNATRARALIWLVRMYKTEPRWLHFSQEAPKDLVSKGGEFAQLRHWDLIIDKPNDDPAKRASGLWQPTQLGIDFVDDQVLVNKYVILFDNEVRGWSEAVVDIRGALGKKFNYEELMEWG